MAVSTSPDRRSDAAQEADEITPLLGTSANGGASSSHTSPADADKAVASTSDQQKTADGEPPMPYVQVLVICYASIAEPIAFFGIVPFINEMIERNGNLPETDVGYWAGTIESLFSLVQMTLMIFYGRMSDRLGRKPVLVFSLVGMSVAVSLFGLSKTLWQMIVFRCFAGMFGGNVVTARAMLSENTTKATQGRAFSWYMFVRNLGISLGPLIGGVLANPADQFPNTFRGIAFFEEYPYALATFVSGAVCMSGALLSFFFLKETLVREDSGAVQAEAPMSTREILRAPGVAMILYYWTHVMIFALAYSAVAPVFLFTSVEKGGCGLSPTSISYFLAITGVSQAAWLLLVFPPMQLAIGTGNVLRICGVIWPIFMSMFPLVNGLLRREFKTLPWAIGIPSLVLGSSVAMTYASVQLCINDISPSPTALGTLNAISLTFSSGVRAVAPALFTSIFAFGVKIGWANGQLVWFFLIFLAATQNIPLYFLPKAVEGRIKEQNLKPSSDSDIADDGVIR